MSAQACPRARAGEDPPQEVSPARQGGAAQLQGGQGPRGPQLRGPRVRQTPAQTSQTTAVLQTISTTTAVLQTISTG